MQKNNGDTNNGNVNKIQALSAWVEDKVGVFSGENKCMFNAVRNVNKLCGDN